MIPFADCFNHNDVNTYNCLFDYKLHLNPHKDYLRNSDRCTFNVTEFYNMKGIELDEEQTKRCLGTIKKDEEEEKK